MTAVLGKWADPKNLLDDRTPVGEALLARIQRDDHVHRLVVAGGMSSDRHFRRLALVGKPCDVLAGPDEWAKCDTVKRILRAGKKYAPLLRPFLTSAVKPDGFDLWVYLDSTMFQTDGACYPKKYSLERLRVLQEEQLAARIDEAIRLKPFLRVFFVAYHPLCVFLDEERHAERGQYGVNPLLVRMVANLLKVWDHGVKTQFYYVSTQFRFYQKQDLLLAGFPVTAYNVGTGGVPLQQKPLGDFGDDAGEITVTRDGDRWEIEAAGLELSARHVETWAEYGYLSTAPRSPRFVPLLPQRQGGARRRRLHKSRKRNYGQLRLQTLTRRA